MEFDPSIPLRFEDNFNFDLNLREVPRFPERVEKRIGFLFSKMRDDDDVFDRIRHLSEIGVLRRIMGALDQAEIFIGKALSYIQEDDLGPSLFVVHGCRLANVWQWQERFEESNPMFDDLIAIAEEHEDCLGYRDFVYQHAGKNLFDQKRLIEALNFFEKALALRLEKDNQGLISSSNFAIDLTRKMLSTIQTK